MLVTEQSVSPLGLIPRPSHNQERKSSPMSTEIISVLLFLLPGFVAAGVFHSLTAHLKSNTFERVIQALIFTFIIQVSVWLLPWFEGPIFSVEPKDVDNHRIAMSVVVAVLFGLGWSGIVNNDLLHRWFRSIRFTKENSYPSEWYSAFSRHEECWIILHLKDQRRIYGWSTEWPGQPDSGHFLIEEGAWLIDKSEPMREIPGPILIPASEVNMVEFVPQSPA